MTDKIMDFRVKKAILQDPGITFSSLCARLGVRVDGPSTKEWRSVDRSLQKLRKQGDIEYTRKTGWLPKGEGE
jgi:hypothetical protein